MKKNGTTTKGTTRWRCKNPDCGCSTTRHRKDQALARDFTTFHRYVTTTAPLTRIASEIGCSRWTLDRKFEPFWLINVPHTPDPNRVYDQIFIDGTYTDAGCLLVAASHDHVITWHWTQRETAHAYTQLLKNIAPPLCVVLDGGQGAYSAIKACWPNHPHPTLPCSCPTRGPSTHHQPSTHRRRQSYLRPGVETDPYHHTRPGTGVDAASA